MLNWIWLLLVLIAVLCAAFLGRMDALTSASIDGAKDAVILAIGLIGVMAFWLGMMRVLADGGFLKAMASKLKPIMTWLFPEVPGDHPAMSAMIMNMASNMLGLGNAATPFGLKAMTELDKLNPHKGTATDAMCLFLAINTSNVAILPLGVIAMRASLNSTQPAAILITTLVATSCSTVVAIIVAKALSRLPIFAARAAAAAEPEAPTETSETAATPPARQKAHLGVRITLWVFALSLLAAMGLHFKKELSTEVLPNRAPITASQSVRTEQDKTFTFDLKATDPEGGDLAIVVTRQPAHGTLTISGVSVTFQPEAGFTGDDAFIYTASDGQLTAQPQKVILGVVTRPLVTWGSVLRNMLSFWLLPLLIAAILMYGVSRRVKVYESVVEGAKEGFQVAIKIIPYLVAILVAVKMFRASGAMDIMVNALTPITSLIGMPAETLPMALLRPLSGSGAYGVMAEIMQNSGPDSFIGLIVSTMQGSTETTFYVLAVYFGAAQIRSARHALPACLVADAVGVLATVAICWVMFGGQGI